MLTINFFSFDNDIILSYTKIDYWLTCSYTRNYFDAFDVQPSRKDKFGINNIVPSFEEYFEVLKKIKFLKIKNKK